ncbi:neurogenic locus notch homolog protein 1 isoform X1 [Gadus macrocephalus]|uniref:neurogenic locus notch homolog protein 1 isoform X1 n=1 Tax=Gadus macrocephalus TaxID=80720 RepID=UPI0028CB58B1|nr:neurogenic locus notch homolog protein 1 isoform X1 [Gadus macrocephalus]
MKVEVVVEDSRRVRWLMARLLVVLGLCRLHQAAPSDPWGQCPVSRHCQEKFGDGTCNKECTEPRCLLDGLDCLKERGKCNPGHIQYCRDHYANSHCEQGCDSAPCGWDGSDCFTHQTPVWAKGTLVVHCTHAGLPPQRAVSSNSSLLWALSVLLRTSLKLRAVAPLAPTRDIHALDAPQLAELLEQPTAGDAGGSVLFLQVDNRPCSRLPSSCFLSAAEAGGFLRAVISKRPPSFPTLTELRAVIDVRGFKQEIGPREEEVTKETKEAVDSSSPAWLWVVIALAVGLALASTLAVLLAVRRFRRRRRGDQRCPDREGGGGVGTRHRSTAAGDTSSGGGGGDSKAWHRQQQHSGRQEPRSRSGKERERNGLKKKKKAKELEKKRRREPLGEDAMRMMRPQRDLDIGSDTDFTQSSMEDINARCSRRQQEASICDHRSQEQKHYRAGHTQTPRPMQTPPRGWKRNNIPPPLLSPPQQTAPVHWCGPDGSVVLIRAVRSGLDRVVLELLRAGVPVNNTDHTGRSALHWACSVNHLSLTRTLIRYGAAVDLQDNKGETALFLSALHGCYDTTRLLLLNGANQELHDRRGRCPIDMAREGVHHQLLELLLAHRVQRGPITVEPVNDMLWEERGLMYSPWAGSAGIPGRSASFSGVLGHRDMTPPPQSDWSVGRVQYPSPQNWRPQQLNQSATALVPPRVMGRSPRPIATLAEVTSEDEDRERPLEVPRAVTPHFLSPQPAPRQRSFSCTQHALQRHSSGPPQPEPNYVVVTDGRPPNEGAVERGAVIPPPRDVPSIPDHPATLQHSQLRARTEAAVVGLGMGLGGSSEQKSRFEAPGSHANTTQTAL